MSKFVKMVLLRNMGGWPCFRGKSLKIYLKHVMRERCSLDIKERGQMGNWMSGYGIQPPFKILKSIPRGSEMLVGLERIFVREDDATELRKPLVVLGVHEMTVLGSTSISVKG